MREVSRLVGSNTINMVEFNSISDLVSFLKEAKTTTWFKGHEKSIEQNKKRTEFAGTKTFNEAMGMLENGWYEEAKKIEKELSIEKRNVFEKDEVKFIQSVAGFHPIVPSYLMGLPNSMVSSKIVAKKQKVVTLNLSISFSAIVSAKEIEDVCIKALRIVKSIESKGYRVNFNVFFAAKETDYTTGHMRYAAIKLKVKNANERLNISKVCFPVVHPSMLRRIFFRVVETSPSFSKEFVYGYGIAMSNEELTNVYKDVMKGEYIIPTKTYGNKSSTKAENMFDRLIKV